MNLDEVVATALLQGEMNALQPITTDVVTEMGVFKHTLKLVMTTTKEALIKRQPKLTQKNG